MTENGAFKLRSDIHTPTAPSCRGSKQRFTIEKSREATTHKFPISVHFANLWVASTTNPALGWMTRFLATSHRALVAS